MSDAERYIVHVAKEGRAAFSQPAFLFKVGNKYYTTLAVLEYDPDASGLTDQQISDIDKLGKIYDSLEDADRLGGKAVSLHNTHWADFIQSAPHR